MKRYLVLFPILMFSSFRLLSQNVGINTTTPQATLDVNGDIVLRTAPLAVADGITLALDVNTSRFSYYRITGPTADFTIAGITAGADGRLVTLFNQSGFVMQLNNEDPTAAAADMIITGTTFDITISNKGIITLQYDGVEQKWIVKSSSKSGGGGVGPDGWDISGPNIFYTTGNVGIGTELPATKLTVQTDLNSDGISHVGGADEIILKSSMGTSSALFGTSTNNIFSLTAGGAGKLHIWPGGAVVIGDDSGGSLRTEEIEDEPLSRLTIKTLTNTTGWEHIGGENEIIVNEAIGGVSASIGTMTNHAIRLKAAGVGRFHVYPDGKIVAGSNGFATNSYGRLFIESDLGYGINHTDGVISVGTYVGGFPATGWFGTISNHPLSFFANNGGALMTILQNGRVGIGTNAPGSPLSFPNTLGNKISFWNVSPTVDLGIGINGGVMQFYTNVTDKIAFGWGNSTAFNETITFFNGTGQMGIGTSNIGTYRLAVNGNIRSKEVVVESVWADYVFDANYKLRPLEEVEKFIKQNKHLPDIPPAKEIDEKGLQLGDIQKRMMEKIEELTLYIIEQDKQIKALRKDIELNKKNSSIN